MKLISIKEGGVNLKVPDPKKYALNADMPVFFNAVMRLNRDITVLVLRACLDQDYLKKGFTSLDLLAGTGAKGLRIAKEVNGAGEVVLNDMNPDAAKLIKDNAKLNKLKVRVLNKPANVLLSDLESYHFIDLDPFGTPVGYLDLAIKRLKPHGIIAVTATDTAALCGAAPKACLRKYGAKPKRCSEMKEIGLRILIRKVQEVAAQYDVALTPIYSHSSNHYLRAYLKKDNGAQITDEVIKKFGMYKDAGPLWLGELWNRDLVKKVEKLAYLSIKWQTAEKIVLNKIKKEFGLDLNSSAKINVCSETAKLARTISREAEMDMIGFIDLESLGLKQVPQIQSVIDKLINKGYRAARTHFTDTGIRTNAKMERFI